MVAGACILAGKLSNIYDRIFEFDCFNISTQAEPNLPDPAGLKLEEGNLRSTQFDCVSISTQLHAIQSHGYVNMQILKKSLNHENVWRLTIFLRVPILRKKINLSIRHDKNLIRVIRNAEIIWIT